MTICQQHQIECSFEKKYKLFGKEYTSLQCPKCEEEFKEEERLLKSAEEKQREITRIAKRNEGIPPRFQCANIENFENISIIKKWIENPVDFLFITGECGTGKTHLAAAIAYYFRDKKINCSFAIASNLFLQLRKSFSDKSNEQESDIIQKYTTSKIAVFDDIGAQKISEFVIESWYNIIDTRYGNQLPTIFTSNMDIKELSIYMSDRIASRIASGILFELKGPDRRLPK